MTAAPFEIKVVYDAARSKRRGTVVQTSSHAMARGSVNWLALGAVLNIAIAGAMYWTTWWKADPFLYLTMLKKTPMDVSPDFAANPFGFRSARRVSEPEVEPQPQETPPAADGSPRWTGKIAQRLIPVTAYAWLTFTTAGVFAVGMAGGAWLGALGGHWIRVCGFVGLLLLLCGLGYFAYQIWAKYEMMYQVWQLRVGMGLLTLLMALMGLALASRVRGITRLAGFSVLLAALGTVAGIWLWAQSGALDMPYARWQWLLRAFLVHGVWGFVLLGAANRVRG